MQKQKQVKIVLGITGNIGSGKSTVARMFKTKDAFLIDADLYARRLLNKDRRIYQKILKSFGRGILERNKISRERLAKVVFADKARLFRLNKILHPVLIREIKGRIRNSDKSLIILDAALILETGLEKVIDKLVVVNAGKSRSIERKSKDKRFTKQDILSRMKSQIPQSEKLRFADFIIDNSGNIGKTRKQVSGIRRALAR
ncbi:MAG: dephospho-CoA kinase [Candidatus Omnitrophota bacterium]